MNILKKRQEEIELPSKHYIVDGEPSRTTSWNFVKVDISMRHTPSRHVQYSVLTRSNHGGLPNEPCSGRLSSAGSLKVSVTDNNHYKSHMTHMLRNAFSWKFNTHRLPRNANTVDLRNAFFWKFDTKPPHIKLLTLNINIVTLFREI